MPMHFSTGFSDGYGAMAKSARLLAQAFCPLHFYAADRSQTAL